MKTDLEVEVEVDLRPLGKVLIFRDPQTDRQLLLYINHHHKDHHQLDQRRLMEETMGPLTSTTAWLTGSSQSIASSETS